MARGVVRGVVEASVQSFYCSPPAATANESKAGSEQMLSPAHQTNKKKQEMDEQLAER